MTFKGLRVKQPPVNYHKNIMIIYVTLARKKIYVLAI